MRYWTTPSLNDPEEKELLRLCTYEEMRFSHLSTTTPTKILKMPCKECEEDVGRIGRTGGCLVRRTPEKLFLCQQCSEPLCADCEKKVCTAKVLKFLQDVHKAERSPEMQQKLRAIVGANTFPYDGTWRLLNAP